MRCLVIALVAAFCAAAHGQAQQQQRQRFLSSSSSFGRDDRQLDFGDANSRFSSNGGNLNAFILSPGVAAPPVEAVEEEEQRPQVLSNFIDNGGLAEYGRGQEELPGYGEEESEESLLSSYGDSALSSYGEEQQESRLSETRTTLTTSSSGLDALLAVVPGQPERDYPTYAVAPVTSFTCDDKAPGGYYADREAGCQSFHICGQSLEGSMVAYTFLCPNGTIFNQEYFICDWWFNVECEDAEALAVARNQDLLRERQEAEARLAAARSQRLQAQGSARVETVVAARQPEDGYRAAEASANVVSVVVEQPTNSYSVPEESASRLESVVIREPARGYSAEEAASAVVEVEEVAPVPAPAALYETPRELQSAAPSAPVTIVRRVQQPVSGYTASEAARTVVVEEELEPAAAPAIPLHPVPSPSVPSPSVRFRPRRPPPPSRPISSGYAASVVAAESEAAPTGYAVPATRGGHFNPFLRGRRRPNNGRRRGIIVARRRNRLL